MSSVNRESLTSSFLIKMPFISFSCLISLDKTPNVILNRSGERDFPGGPMVKDLPSSAGDAGSIPGWATKPARHNY